MLFRLLTLLVALYALAGPAQSPTVTGTLAGLAGLLILVLNAADAYHWAVGTPRGVQGYATEDDQEI